MTYTPKEYDCAPIYPPPVPLKLDLEFSGTMTQNILKLLTNFITVR